MSKDQKISDNLPVIQYIGNGVTCKFPFPFLVFKETDLVVYVGDRQVTEGFSFEITEGIEGGTLIFNSAPAKDSVITIARNLSFEVLAMFTDGGYLHPQVLNTEFNHTVGLCQQLRSNVSRCLQYPVYQRNMDPVLPTAQPGHALLWDENGTGFRNSKFTIDDSVALTIQKAEEAAVSAAASEESHQNSSASAEAAAQSAQEAAASAQSAADVVHGFDDHAALRQQEFNTNAEQKTVAEIEIYDQHAAAKEEIINAAVAAAASSEEKAALSEQEARRFRDEAEQIVSIPPASLTVAGVAFLASADEMSVGINNSKIVTPDLAKQELDKKLTAIQLENNRNFNTITGSGVYSIVVDVADDLHQPFSLVAGASHEWIVSVYEVAGIILQEASCLRENVGDVIWRRRCINGTWSEWVVISQDLRNSSQSMLQDIVNVNGANIILSPGITGYWADVSAETTFVIDSSKMVLPADKNIYIDLIINLSTVAAVHWPVNNWLNDDIPDLSSAGIYFVTFVKLKNSTIWRGSNQGKFSA